MTICQNSDRMIRFSRYIDNPSFQAHVFVSFENKNKLELFSPIPTWLKENCKIMTYILLHVIIMLIINALRC